MTLALPCSVCCEDGRNTEFIKTILKDVGGFEFVLTGVKGKLEITAYLLQRQVSKRPQPLCEKQWCHSLLLMGLNRKKKKN